MASSVSYRTFRAVALHPEGVDRNALMYRFNYELDGVALHSEGVDRNALLYRFNYELDGVALHSEGVDRNSICVSETPSLNVALHPEGVDRNLIHDYFFAKSLDVALYPEDAGRTQIVTLDFWRDMPPSLRIEPKRRRASKRRNSLKSAFIGCEKRRMRAFFCR